LEILGKSIDVTVFSMGVDVDPATIAKEAVEKAKLEGYDTVLVDTAGRQVVDEELMEELRRVKRTGECVMVLFALMMNLIPLAVSSKPTPVFC
jgi:signal recognition particle subunit SRP54